MDRPLTAEQRRQLLALARDTIMSRLENRPLPEPRPAEGPLLESRGAFVTLKLSGRLRGCIGHPVGYEPLWQSVRDNAINAAFEDPRFPALTRDETDGLELEISVLTLPEKVADPLDVEVGRDGLIVEQGARRGLLLPQVPVELGWDRQTFLEQTCRKAGLPLDAWRDPETTLWRFSAEVFTE